jgi:3-oxoacyl-(acyl-carrier-protein) synthase
VRRRVVITGAGVISPLGDSPGELHRALCAGESGLKPVEVFATDGLGPRRAGEVRPFEPREYLGERNLRPIDRTARLLLAAAQRALEDSGWTPERRRESEVGLLLGTTFCSVRTIAEFDRRGMQLGPSYVSPFDFANSVINAAAGQAAIWHDLRGVNSTISAGEASGLLALASAADLIRTGRAGALLAGGAEELCYESFLGFDRAGRLCPVEQDPLPFDARRGGFALAEGAALLMLEEAEAAAARGARVLGEVVGSGSAFDASLDGEGMAGAVARALRLALADAGLEPAAIGCLSAGANGSVEADRREARGVAEAFGGATLPVTAIKSMLGEALGASGAFQAVALLGTLGDGVLPGIRGLGQPAEDCPLSNLSAASRRLDSLRHGIAVAAGSGGHTCAVVLGSGVGSGDGGRAA